MKKNSVLLPLLLLLTLFPLSAQQLRYVEASELTLTGKLFPDTPNPYHRLDTVRFKGFTKAENRQVRESAGIAVAFRTNSKLISVRTVFGQMEDPTNTMGISASGYDLYIRENGHWVWAGSGPRGRRYRLFNVVEEMDGSMHECLLYLPLLSEVLSLKIGVEADAVLEAIPNPFRHRIGIFGSSFTHGISSSRSGMAYPAQLSRRTGVQFLSLGCSGNSKLQPYFADALAQAPVDGFVFDAFSNPSEAQIRARLFPFIEKLIAAHPGKPLIFQSTIRRANRNFDTASETREHSRAVLVDSLMQVACSRYPDVYYIHPDVTDPEEAATVDGIHPSDYGYFLWARSIEKEVLEILGKYGMD